MGLVVKGANTDVASTGSDCKFVLVGRPANVGSRAVDPEDDESRLPDHFASGGIGDLRPDISITILRASNDAVCFRSPIDRSDKLVVLWTEIGENESESE